jgi:site-specific recombinase XerD
VTILRTSIFKEVRACFVIGIQRCFRKHASHRANAVAESRAPAVASHDVLEGLLRMLRDDRGFALATLDNLRRSLRLFLAWIAARGRPWTETTLDDVSAYLASRPQWSRVTIAHHVQCLRTLFRYGAMRGWCRATFAATIDAPRLYTHERLPQGPQWSDVLRLLDANRGDTDVHVRNYAMLLLLAVYGFRSGEVRSLTLDDIDWKNERIHPPRPKQRRVGEYPLVRDVGEAILRYLRHVRPRCSSRAVFVTLRRPHRPLSAGGLATMVRVRQQRLGQTLHRYGPHGLRHASATYLLAEGFTLKQIGDHLGHTMVRATEVYAKVDLVSLREVADLDMTGLVEHERRCASRATPFFVEGSLGALREVARVALGGVR